MPPKSTPNYLMKAHQAANLRFLSTAQTRIPHWSKPGRVKRSPATKKAVEEQVRLLSSRLSPPERISFFRAYRTLVAGRIQALETAEKIYKKHAAELTSTDYRIYIKGLKTFRIELTAAAGKENANRVTALLSKGGVINTRPTPPIYRTREEAFALIEKNKVFVRGVIRNALRNYIHPNRLRQEVDELYSDIQADLMLKCQRFNADLGIDFLKVLRQYVKQSVGDVFRTRNAAEGYSRNKGRIASIHSLESGGERSPFDIEDLLASRKVGSRGWREVLLLAYDRLPSKEQDVIIAHNVIGESLKAVAVEMGVTKGYVSKLNRQALARMRKLLEKYR